MTCNHSSRRALAPRLLTLIAAAVLLCTLISAAPASARRHVKFGFMGTVLDPGLVYYGTETPQTVDAQMALMARSGVESIRTNFFWPQAEPARGVFNWGPTDLIVAAAAAHGLSVLPIIEFTPLWASSRPDDNGNKQPPAHNSDFAAFMTAVVKRYGHRGSFWKQHHELRADPITDWQIWNEPAGNFDWRPKPWAPSYVRLLKAGYRAVHRADRDRHTRVVTGAMVGLNQTNLTPWRELSDLYRYGARKYFDVVAVNAFTSALNDRPVRFAVRQNLRIAKRVRAVMRAHHDGKKPIYATEFAWTSALGRIAPADYLGFETTSSGQAKRMSAFYRQVAAHHDSGITRAYWYTWYSPYKPQSITNLPTFQYAGLTSHLQGGPFATTPLLSAYRRVAASVEGCRKTANAKRCR